MKRLILASMALLAGTAALAQTTSVAPPAPPAPMAHPAPPAPMAHPMGDKVMTRTEMVAMVREHFGQMDVNKDGTITTAEIAETREKWVGQHKSIKGGAPHTMQFEKRDPNAAFDRLDTNKDGSISRDEFAKAHEERIERRVEIRKERQEGAKDGKDGKKQAWRMHRGMGGERMIVMADTNKDGKITLIEAETLALQHFDQMDTNHDGQVTPDERRAARPMMIKQMQAPSAG
jgi:Ca2+-binding EF-hand superfamily protein